jgi:hypothetical protein
MMFMDVGLVGEALRWLKSVGAVFFAGWLQERSLTARFHVSFSCRGRDRDGCRTHVVFRLLAPQVVRQAAGIDNRHQAAAAAVPAMLWPVQLTGLQPPP